MTKFLVIILSIACFVPQAFGLGELATKIIEGFEHEDSDIVRVRSVKKMNARKKENAVLDFIGLVEQYEGYTAEEYNVTTSDGYILTLHRVNGSPSSPPAAGKPVVYIGHGLLASSDFFAILGPRQALLFMLADAGYDIFIGNCRGNTYSRRHIKYSNKSNDLDFWGFSMDELALIDLPLFIDTVLEMTNKTKLSYVGYSMGTTLSAMLLSAKPEYNDKMHVVVGIAPVVLFTPPYSSLARKLLTVAGPVKALARTTKSYQILPQSKLIKIIGKYVCASRLGGFFCEGFLNKIVHINRMNTTVIPAILQYVPAGASLFTIDQYIQFAVSTKFRRYDYGLAKNLMKYRSPTPPQYDLTKVTSLQALFYSDGDVFSNVRDVGTLNRTFPNVVALEKVAGFNHLDYMWLDEAKDALYNRLLQIIKENLN